jgi:hypothetical protein
MRAGRSYFYPFRLRLFSVRFAIVFVSLFLIYQRITVLNDHEQSDQVEKLVNKYNLVEKYEQDKLLDVDPPFKRILFWNDVR